MANVIIRPSWWIPGRHVTPERAYHSRRAILKQLGLGTLALAGGGLAARSAEPAADPYGKGYPHPRSKDFDPGWKLTDEKVASTYNNFYEFTLQKDVHRHVGKFTTAPWPIEIGGLGGRPLTLDAAPLLAQQALGGRVVRLRFVEAGAMIVPWTGFPFAKIAELVRPQPEAKFVRFITALRPDEMPGIARAPDYPWPYFEGLRLDEALHPLTFVATGIYGKPLAKQFGPPLRLVVPWKYGYKSIKSLVKIEFVERQPKTFWETLQPQEYPFESNVDPAVPHPRWSQATERMIDTGDRVRTRKYNGYEEAVAGLYAKGG
ncbi:MAG TPA: protein-methionine-sulfoxide reductase catalytic subunit MsrP [Verrucomicrobiota bacterium]|nr:protein-methionine-sulfoxide reductase catalytic subunit MsrP [Verrucomicrobiota bacterium]